MLGDPMMPLTIHPIARVPFASAALEALVRAADVLSSHWTQKRAYRRVISAFEDLREHEFGGIALMLEALPAAPAVTVGAQRS